MMQMSTLKDKSYTKVRSNSTAESVTSQFSIIEEDDDDDMDEISFESHHNMTTDRSTSNDRGSSMKVRGVWGCMKIVWSTLTFSWMEPLLTIGNQRPLEKEDLFKLQYRDSADGVYKKFKAGWSRQLQRKDAEPSITWTFLDAFGTPFLLSGLLKLINDSCMFVGPLLLNKIIHFLNDSHQPLQVGLSYVFGLFAANLLMSLCLRQYFWWCYRVGMNLRTSVVTAVYHKSLAISAASLSRKTLGEITNLMSVDSSRLQDLTPYLHALWYSLFQIVVAMFLLWQQVGISCLSGFFFIVVTIPITRRMSMHMKSLQKSLSSLRDERIKLTNEVLNGMKVIKLQAWEAELQHRVQDVRERELAVFRTYSISQCLSGVLYTTIPLLVSIATFATYIALGHQLDVATALTSLALFDLLRFPLFMLPQVLNSVVEARVSVDRIQSYLLEPEKVPVHSHPLKGPGILMKKATLLWDSALKRRGVEVGEDGPTAATDAASTTIGARIGSCFSVGLALISCNYLGDRNAFSTYSRMSAGSVDASIRSRSNSTSSMTSESSSSSITTTSSRSQSKPHSVVKPEPLSEEEIQRIVSEAQIIEAERTIDELEHELSMLKGRQLQQQQDEEVGEEGEGVDTAPSRDDFIIDMDSSSATGLAGRDVRTLTLSRISVLCGPGQLVSIVGPVGSGKSSMLSALLGDMRCCYGQVAVCGSIAYAAQIAFIQNSTLRDNILYGSAFNQHKYEDTLRICALLPDIKVLPAGHDTEIGERGINLSGGQKARVGLARAVYADADIYLLDDPLSAVDAHVGQHLFEECILHLQRRGKCVVFVTNALQFVKTSSHIVVLKDGHVSECGTYQQLLQGNKGFSEMINTMTDSSSSNSSKAARLSPSPSSSNVVLKEDDIGLKAIVDDVDDDAVVVVSSPLHGTSSSSSTTSKVASTTTEQPVSIIKDRRDDDDDDSKVSIKKSASLITEEDRQHGDVGMQIYYTWARAAGGISVGVIVLVLFIVGEAISVFSSWWLSYWSQNLSSGRSPWFYLGIYVVINAGVVLLTFAKEFYLRMRGLHASKSLFQELLQAVLFSPMGFFDTTPLGRIINRFSKDVYTVDEQLPQTVRAYIGTMARVFSTLAYIVVITPLFLVGLVPVFIFYYFAQRYYIKTSRELTRLESTSRSPIYALFSETLDGLSTIRAYGAEQRLILKNDALLDTNVQSFFLNFSANCWLGVRLEFTGTLIVTFAALFAVLSRVTSDSDVNGPVDSVEQRQAFAGLAGLSISFALAVTQSLNWTVRMASDMEGQMVSVERIKSYAGMSQEAAHFLPSDPITEHSAQQHHHRPSSYINTWPSQGVIAMNNVTMRYRDGLPLVLKGMTLTINAHEKVGIAGRTGAGKSSLLTALLRLVELEGGSITIDGVDISKIGLNTLRSVMAVIPQDPVLFSGTIRSNLDPFERYSDADIWEGLRRTLLVGAVGSLDDKVTENGANFSVGQRQLLCIARALLSKAKIIIMDEATAAVDVETDAVIQQTIRTEFSHATCLTVAHRLNTIMDSDKVLVMDNGTVGEFDTPARLLADDRSMFYSLVTNWENSH